MSDTSLTEFQKKKRAELEMALKQSGQSNVPPQPQHDDQHISEQERDDLKKGETDHDLADKPVENSESDHVSIQPTVNELQPVDSSSKATDSETEELTKEDYLIAKQVTSETQNQSIPIHTEQIQAEEISKSDQQIKVSEDVKLQTVNSIPEAYQTEVGVHEAKSNTEDINSKVQENAKQDENATEKNIRTEAVPDDSNKTVAEGEKPQQLQNQKGVNVNINLNLSPEGLKSSKELAGKSYDKVTSVFEKLITTTFKPVDDFEEYDHFVEGKIDPKYSVKLARQMLTVSVLFVFVLVIFAVVNNILGTIVSITFLREICFVVLMVGLSLLLYKYQKYLYLDHPYPIVVMTGGVLLGIIALLLLVNHFYITFLATAGLSAFLFYYGVTRIDKDLTKLSKQFSDPGKEKNCPNCGNKIKKGENYCYNCEEYVY